MATVQELLVKITGDASGFKKALDETKNASSQIGSAFESVGQKMTNIGKTATAALTVPIAGAATASVKNFAEVDKTMTLTNATMQNTEQEAKLLEQAMMSAAQNSTYGMQDAATASLNFARAGLTAEEAASAMAPAMNLAAGEGGNLDTVSQGLVATINGFGDSFSRTTDYADVFANACNNSALDIDSLSGAMAIAAPIFSTAGYSINDAALYMGVMANAGIGANEAATSLKTGLARLIEPSKQGAEWMEKLGINVTNADGSMKDSVTVQKELHDAFSTLSESEQIAAASAIFGKNQMDKWLALINTAPQDVSALNSSLGEMGTTSEMADAMMSGFGGSLEKLKSSIDVASYSFGQALAPSISKVADIVQKAVDWFNSLNDSQKETIAKAALTAAAFGPILIVFGKVFGSIGQIIGGLGKVIPLFTGGGGLAQAASAAGSAAAGSGGLGAIAGACSAAIAVIGLVVAAVYSIVESFGGVEGAANRIKQMFTNVFDAIQEKMEKVGINDKLEKLKEQFDKLKDALGNMKDFWEVVFTVIEKVAIIIGENLVTAFGVLIDVLGDVIEFITGLIDILGGLGELIVGIFTGDIDKVKEGAIRLWDGVKEVFTSAINAIGDIIKGLYDIIIGQFEAIKNALIGDPIVIDMWEGIKNVFDEGVQKVVDFIKGLVEKVIQFFTDLKDKVVEKVTELKDKVTEIFNNLTDKPLEKISQFKDKAIETFGKLKEKAVEHFNNMKDKIIETTNNIKDKVQDHWTKMKEKVTTLTSELHDKIKDAFTKIKEQITTKVTEAKTQAQQKFTELKTQVVSKMQETVSNVKQKLDDMVSKFKGIDLKSVGTNIVRGFLDGLKGAWDSVKSWVSDACSSIKDKFTSAMKIHSPSKVFFEYGQFIDQGLVNGLNKGLPAINSAIDRMNTSVSSNFDANANANGAVSSGNMTINLNGDYMFQDKASMDYFLNRMQLAIQRA